MKKSITIISLIFLIFSVNSFAESPQNTQKKINSTWKCSNCGTLNENIDTICINCMKPNHAKDKNGKCQLCHGKGLAPCKICNPHGNKNIPTYVKCSVCNGTKKFKCTKCNNGILKTTKSKCDVCNGCGYVWRSKIEGIYLKRFQIPCTKCGGVSETNETTYCSYCNGKQFLLCKSCDSKGEVMCLSCQGKGFIKCSCQSDQENMVS